MKALDFDEWYEWNFKRNPKVVQSVEELLSTAFQNRERRAFNIWIEVPENDKNYIDNHMQKLKKQLSKMGKIGEQADTLANTITNIDLI